MIISIFFKPCVVEAFAAFILVSLIAGFPYSANAGFFGDLVASVIGEKTQAEELDSTHNSQTMPLLETESSINPDKKNTAGAPEAVIDDEGVLSVDNSTAIESDTVSYISSSEKINTYKVQKGDTIGGIAAKFGISKNTILYANTNIKNNVLTVGQTLIILPVDGVSYTVKKGDTISSIAKIYKADANDIAEYNDITDKSLKIGDKIIVPGGTVTKKPETTSPSKTTKETPQYVQRPTETPSISTGGGITGGYIWPFPAGSGRVSQRLHDDNAYDFAAPKGTPIYAIQDGTVLIADASGYNGGYGLYVVIDFNDGGQAIFGHMSKVAATAGETVRRGDIIGYVGSTGRSTGNHVHIGYRGGKTNPYRNLPLNSRGN